MEPLLDPENDRVVKDVIAPPHRPISTEILYPNKGIITSSKLAFA